MTTAKPTNNEGDNTLIYLASPYSHPDPAIREWRFEAACKASAEMLRSGLIVICPVILGHPLTKYGLPGDWQFWQNFDRAYLQACSAMAILSLDAWRESEGIANEIKIANELDIPFWTIEPERFGIAVRPEITPAAENTGVMEEVC